MTDAARLTQAMTERTRAATTTLRDAAREGRRIDFRERDPLVMAIHDALDALEAERDHLAAQVTELSSHTYLQLMQQRDALEAERDQLKADIDAAHEVLHDGAPIQQGTSRETLRTLTLVERIREVFDTCGYLDDKVTAAEAERDHRQAALVALRQQVEQFTERCRELRNSSPNLFYQHVDAFCARLTPAPSSTPP